MSYYGSSLSKRFRSGFTILELLTVFGMISVLMAMLLPAVNSAREAARRIQCISNLHQIGIALHSYHEVWQGLPPGWNRCEQNHSAWGWAPPILSYLEERGVYSQIHFSEAINADQNSAVRKQSLPILLCPSDITEPVFSLFREVGEHDLSGQSSKTVLVKLPSANYLGVFGTKDPDDIPGHLGTGSFLESRSVRFSELRRGLSQTLLVGERTARKMPSTWLGFHLYGEDVPGRVVGFADKGPNLAGSDECEFDSRHPGIVNFLWADGHVKSISESINPAVYRSLATRATDSH